MERLLLPYNLRKLTSRKKCPRAEYTIHAPSTSQPTKNLLFPIPSLPFADNPLSRTGVLKLLVLMEPVKRLTTWPLFTEPHNKFLK